jgi:hypothetical protein
MSKHTPGPWRLELVEDRSIKHLCPVDANDLSILTIVHHDETPFAAVYKDADARLIAAAPELLEALREAADYTRHPDYDWPVEFSRRVSAAIAKAEGRPCA